MSEWYRINNINEVDTPALVVYPQRVKANIALALSMVGNADRLRPHVKTHKTKEITRLMLEAGITRFKCATIAEAEMLAMVNAPDVLLAYQPVGPKISRLLELISKYPQTRFSCLVDNTEAAVKIDEAAQGASAVIKVYIDINVGMNRTGILPEKVFVLFKEICALKNIRFIGLHAYDGHITDPDYEIRKQQSDAVFDQVTKIKDAIMNAGSVKPALIIGGSPTFSVHARRADVECSPGTFVYWDYGYATRYKEHLFQPAALVVTRVISLPEAGIVCTDLGHKSVAAENPLNDRVHFLNAPDVLFEGQSEEHLKLRADKEHLFKIGEALYGMPVHICPTCALYERAIVVENGIAAGEWENTARDRKITV
ncbi:threonine aldolase [Niabella ginsenosidivorans]|uniref:Threonine aldolase n=1 Tax=Niabella ginsenosidivorans TaxID=1176587 RepID=A0A1A9I941_9BACT|nr:D-TA family PLP-dependent enzyme [Niabella ginsenosidivorans]ANH83034.1 threonine aldolase [Niabella ginsenosidivorans]